MITFTKTKLYPNIPPEIEKRIVSWTEKGVEINDAGLTNQEKNIIYAYFVGQGYEQV
jgi:hypothetical protein